MTKAKIGRKGLFGRSWSVQLIVVEAMVIGIWGSFEIFHEQRLFFTGVQSLLGILRLLPGPAQCHLYHLLLIKGGQASIQNGDS